MRRQRTRRMSTPAPTSTPASALEAARELKQRFPRLQVKVFDAEKKQSETIELAAAYLT